MTWTQPLTADQGLGVGGYEYRVDGGAWTTAGNGAQDLALSFAATHTIDVATLNLANVRGIPHSLSYTLGVPSFTPANAVNRGVLPDGLDDPQGITWDGVQYVIVNALLDDIWTFADATDPGSATNQGALPNDLASPQGITWDGGQYVIVDDDRDEIWILADATNPGGATNQGEMPNDLSNPEGITWDGGQYVIVVRFPFREVWTLADATNPGSAVKQGRLPSLLTRPEGITWDGGQYIIVDGGLNGIWTFADATNPGSAGKPRGGAFRS